MSYIKYVCKNRYLNVVIIINYKRGFHTSGHASEPELEWIINAIDPDVTIPVHTENVEWVKEMYIDRAKALEK